MIRFRKFFTCTIFTSLAVIGLVSAQSPQIDSLKSLIAAQKEDTVKVNLLIELGTEYLSSSIDDALASGNQARELAAKLNHLMGQGYACKLVGLAYSIQGKYSESNILFNEGLEIFEKIPWKTGVANMLELLGTNHDELGYQETAIEYYLRALRLAEEINDSKRIGSLLLNLGGSYGEIDPNSRKSFDYFFRASKLLEEIGDDIGRAIALANIATIHFNNEAYDSALLEFNESLKLLQGYPESSYLLNYIGEIYAVKENFDSAVWHHNESIELAKAFGDKLGLSKAFLSKAHTLNKQRNLLASIETYKEGLNIAEEINARYEMRIAYEALAEVYATLGDFKNAYAFGNLLNQIKDTIFNSDKAIRVQDMAHRFEIDKKESQISLQEATIEQQRIMNWAAGITGFLILLMAIGLFNRYKYVKKTNKIIKSERDRSKELLLNILPEETAMELETKGHAKTRYYESVTVLFTDFKGFSSIAGKLRPQELVAELNDYFMEFDAIVEKFGLEKIKTIGDAYMCAGGIPVSNETHALDAVKAALAMQEYMKKKKKELEESGAQGWELRVGIHTGPIVAGVVGKKKYAYDIWGDTVNVASRMESNGEPGKVNISSSTYNLIKERYECHHRGKISAKNIGEVDMYFIEREVIQESIAV